MRKQKGKYKVTFPLELLLRAGYDEDARYLVNRLLSGEVRDRKWYEMPWWEWILAIILFPIWLIVSLFPLWLLISMVWIIIIVLLEFVF